MTDAYDFLISLRKRFDNLKKLLSETLRQEELFEKDILVKKGFLIRRYSAIEHLSR